MSEWISVDDEMPQIETDTLLVCIKCKVEGESFSDTDGFEDGDFVYWSRQANAKITHWMYLPEPPNIK